jgi:hypothetical protein
MGGLADNVADSFGNDEEATEALADALRYLSSSKKNWIMGSPDYNLISTSYVERLNASPRLPVKRLGRLTLAF